MTNASILADIEDYRVNFDSIYIAGIPRLLDGDGAFLSFITVLTGVEALAGLYAPGHGTGERFRRFVSRYFPKELGVEADRLWVFRNAMIHSFHPGPYALTHHNSRNHLKTTHGPPMLNAEDFYAALLVASQAYFAALETDADLQACFMKRLAEAGGGAPESWVVQKVRTDR